MLYRVPVGFDRSSPFFPHSKRTRIPNLEVRVVEQTGAGQNEHRESEAPFEMRDRHTYARYGTRKAKDMTHLYSSGAAEGNKTDS